MLNTLTEVNTQLENWRNQLKLKLEEVKQEKEENKKNLQAVEEKITQKDLSSDKPKALLRDKEMLLWTQWKLDMIKKDTEIQLLNTEKLKEPIEFQLEPPVDAVQMTIEWGKPDLNPGFVFVRQNGQELQTDQNTAYKGRVSLSIDKLKHGDVSLKLSKVKVSDRGRYRCYIPQQSKEYFVELLVGNPRTHQLLHTEKSADDYNAADDVLKKLKKELENQRKQLEDELDDAKVQLQENKEQLQLVEMKLTQKDTSEKPEALLMEKQKLLHDQWTLDEKKKNCEREILKREELLELTEGPSC
ncbi:BICD family-like cargo adapter 2 [Neolamprologus brichardi]|uniref:BICD family-like cargo adapter 2 n=1 Tax=Neolamprologus brichardi TaxID=32507 RepID=UPI001643CA28|nr:BICD family-like cargo adapter 2 [Neolamprologus brichardi]